MIERQVDVVERITNLVSDGCCKPADDRAFFSLMKLHFEFARAAELRSHLIKGAGECSHLVEPVCGHLYLEVATSDFARRAREFFDRTSEAPDKETGDESSHQQNNESVERGT